MQNPIILGGIIPMICFGLMTFPIKILNGKIHFSHYVLLTGIGITIVGVLALIFFSTKTEISFGQISLGLLNGILWGIGALFIFIALKNPTATVSQLAPIYNINTLIAVFIGIVFFAEWQNIVIWKTILGTILILLGGWFVI